MGAWDLPQGGGSGALSILPYYPEEYGATGDGVTDDTVAVQNCINAAAATTGSRVLAYVQFRAATYLVSGLVLPPGSVLRGINGQDYYNATLTVPNPATQTVLKLTSSATSPLLAPYDGGTNKATACRISDIALNGNGVALGASSRVGTCIDIPDQGGSFSRFWIMEKLYIFNVGGTGSDNSYAVNIGNQNTACVMRDCTLFNGTSGSRSGTNGLAWYGSDNRADNCFIGYFANVGLQTLGGNSDQTFIWRGGGIFTCGTCVSVGGGGMVFEGASIDHSSGDGMYINNGPVFLTDCTFHDNSLQTNGQNSNIRIGGNNVSLSMIGCRAAPSANGANLPKYHLHVTGTGAQVNEVGSANENVAFTIGWTSYITEPVITAATVSGTTVTIMEAGVWAAGQLVTVTGLANGAGTNWTNANGTFVTATGGNGTFTYTVASGTPTSTSNNTGQAVIVGNTLTSPTLIDPTFLGAGWPLVPYVAGNYYPNYAITFGTATPTTGKMYAYPIVVTQEHTFTTIGLWCTAGGTSSVTRLGIYSDNGGTPVGGALLLDAGTATASTGAALTKAISQSLAPGVYWLVAVVNTTSGAPTFNADTSARQGAGAIFGQTAIAAAAAQNTGYVATGAGTTGALPATFPAAAVGVALLVLLGA